MTKDEIIAIFENIARLLELKGENPFKVRAYVNGARALETLSEPLETLISAQRLDEVDGIGKALAGKITALARDGRLEYYDELKHEFPPEIFGLFELRGVGAKRIKALWDSYRISSIAELERACTDGRVAGLPGFGKKTAENIRQAIAQKQSAGRFLLSDAAYSAETILSALREHPDVILAEVAGSYRRRKETIGDLDFIVSSRSPKEVSGCFTSLPVIEHTLSHGETKSSVVLKNGLQCDLRVVKGAEYPFALNYFTGSKEHNVKMRGRALDRGWSLNEYRFSNAEGKKQRLPLPEVHDERDIYHALGLDYVEPELREDRGEIAAAEEHSLPDLVQLANLRGTFHNHTNASDGRASLEEMAEAARGYGLQYLGIADHSKSSFQAHGLDEKRLAAQVARIAELNQKFDGFRLFSGVECDILKNGSLDFADDVLAQLDYVVASVHASFSLSESEMTGRIIRAISNPYVTMLGHLTGRLLLARDPYRVDIAAVIEAAAETGTIIELNANPRRLDMDWRWWPLAKEKGVLCAINPDAHSAHGLQDLFFGVGIARKGWLTRKDVVNCLPLGKIEAKLASKRLSSRAGHIK